MKIGLVFRALRSALARTASPAEIASLDRLVASGDDADIAAVALEASIRDTLIAMDGLMQALFAGLTDAQAQEMLSEESVEQIYGCRDQVASLGGLTSL